jgi:chromosome segregation ATPase
MASEGTFTVPRMGSFKRALLGYRRDQVDAAIGARDARIGELEGQVTTVAELEAELSSLSGMVLEREREIRGLGERLREANERHERSIASLQSLAGRLEEIQSQARGQATRIRMKALKEAVEVSRRAEELAEAQAGPPSDLFKGIVKLEIGPLEDFSQLVGFEDAIGRLGASEISVERFSEGRATLSMQLDEPVELLRELEERAPMEFRVRRTADDNLILDVDDDPGPEQRAA